MRGEHRGADLAWIPAERRFERSDMVAYAGMDERDLDEVLGEIDLVVTGPHATAAFPEELAPHVDPTLTHRLQHDFCDISTSPVARRWAARDPHVLYIENPHPRAVRDANRPRPADLLGSLREAFERIAADSDGRPSLAGVDAVRPVTFGYLPVLRRPTDDADWNRLGTVLAEVGQRGVDAYERVRDELVERVLEAKLRRLEHLDVSRCTAAEMWSATTLLTLSIHDTMNRTARPDGALCVERAPEDQLPSVVALSNRGDACGEVRPLPPPGLRAPEDVPTMPPRVLRAIAEAYRDSFAAHEPGDVAFNRPYLGGHETQVLGPRLRAAEPQAVVRTGAAPPLQIHVGAWQNEFLREFLLGPEATEVLEQPGATWTGISDDRADAIAAALHRAHELVRTGGVR